MTILCSRRVCAATTSAWASSRSLTSHQHPLALTEQPFVQKAAFASRMVMDLLEKSRGTIMLGVDRSTKLWPSCGARWPMPQWSNCKQEYLRRLPAPNDYPLMLVPSRAGSGLQVLSHLLRSRRLPMRFRRPGPRFCAEK